MQKFDIVFYIKLHYM